MSVLRSSDPLPARPKRVLVAGAVAAGKSTLARMLAAHWELPYAELDALYHGPQWQPRPTFRDDIIALAAQDEWVTEWQYTIARPLLAMRADLLVFLDLPRWLANSRVIRRTLRRAVRRSELWNGLREPPLRTILSDPDHIVRWAIRTHHEHAPISRSSGCPLGVRSKRGPDHWRQRHPAQSTERRDGRNWFGSDAEFVAL